MSRPNPPISVTPSRKKTRAYLLNSQTKPPPKNLTSVGVTTPRGEKNKLLSPRGRASEIQESVKLPLNKKLERNVELYQKLLPITPKEFRTIKSFTSQDLMALKDVTVNKFLEIKKMPMNAKTFLEQFPDRDERISEYSKFMMVIRKTEDKVKQLEEKVNLLESSENEYRKGLLNVKEKLEKKLGIAVKKKINGINLENNTDYNIMILINYISILLPLLNSRGDIKLLKNYIHLFKSQYSNYLRELKNNLSDIKKMNIMKKNYFFNHFH